MSEERELLKKRFLELSRKAYEGSYFTFSDFLGLAEQSALKEVLRTLPSRITLFGGASGAERVMVRFGDAEEIGYELPFPIACLKIAPRAPKFADRLTHRDFLGALLNLGIEREVLGDIVIRENVGYLFAKDTIAEFITDSLSRVKHTDVTVSTVEQLPNGELYKTEIKKIQANGERLDAVVAKVFSISRDDASTLFKKHLIFADGREIESVSYIPKVGEVISVRGYGRFISRGYETLTKKGKKNIEVELYV